MEKRQLGVSDLQITVIGLGAWAIGGDWAYGWGPQDDRDSIGAIHAALDAGINWIDTAAIYGLGHSEEVVARAIRERETGERPYVFTKCSLVWDENREISRNLKRDSIRHECEASLRRLQADAIDLYQIHWPNPAEDIEEAWETLAALKTEGKIRWGGVSNFNVGHMERVKGILPIVSLQPPYSLVDRRIEEGILPYCRQNHIGVIVWSPMKGGLLSGRMTRERLANLPETDWRRNSPHFNEPLLSRNLRLVELLREIGDWHERTPGEVAIAWTLRDPAVTGAIVGFRRADQVPGMAGAANFRLSAEELGAIEQFMQANVLPEDKEASAVVDEEQSQG